MQVEIRPQVSDAAKRCANIVTSVALMANAIGDFRNRWVAIRLHDGGSDGVVYDTRDDAIKHQLHEQLCAYVWVPPSGMEPHEAEVFLNYNRALYDNGFRMPDPQVIPPLMREQMASQMKRLGR